MTSFKYLDEKFLNSLYFDTVKSSPNLLPVLFKIYFEMLPVKIEEFEKSLSENNKIILLKSAHYLKGQSSCIGLFYFADIFLQIESALKKNDTNGINEKINLIKENTNDMKCEIRAYLLKLDYKDDIL